MDEERMQKERVRRVCEMEAHSTEEWKSCY